MAQWQKSVPTIDPAGTWLVICPLGDSGEPKGPLRCVHTFSPQEFVADRQVFWSEPVEMPGWPDEFEGRGVVEAQEPESEAADAPPEEDGADEDDPSDPDAE